MKLKEIFICIFGLRRILSEYFDWFKFFLRNVFGLFV